MDLSNFPEIQNIISDQFLNKCTELINLLFNNSNENFEKFFVDISCIESINSYQITKLAFSLLKLIKSDKTLFENRSIILFSFYLLHSNQDRSILFDFVSEIRKLINDQNDELFNDIVGAICEYIRHIYLTNQVESFKCRNIDTALGYLIEKLEKEEEPNKITILELIFAAALELVSISDLKSNFEFSLSNRESMDVSEQIFCKEVDQDHIIEMIKSFDPNNIRSALDCIVENFSGIKKTTYKYVLNQTNHICQVIENCDDGTTFNNLLIVWKYSISQMYVESIDNWHILVHCLLERNCIKFNSQFYKSFEIRLEIIEELLVAVKPNTFYYSNLAGTLLYYIDYLLFKSTTNNELTVDQQNSTIEILSFCGKNIETIIKLIDSSVKQSLCITLVHKMLESHGVLTNAIYPTILKAVKNRISQPLKKHMNSYSINFINTYSTAATEYSNKILFNIL